MKKVLKNNVILCFPATVEGKLQYPIQRMSFKNYLKQFPISDVKNKMGELHSNGLDLIIITDNKNVNACGKEIERYDAYKYFHHDVRMMYLIWRKEMRDLFRETRKILGEDFYNEICSIDTVPSAPLVKEEPDFPCGYGHKWIDNIQRETIEKIKLLEKAKNVYQKYVNNLSCKKLKNLPKKFTWNDVKIRFTDYRSAEIRILDRKLTNEKSTAFDFEDLYFFKKSNRKNDRKPDKQWYLIYIIADLLSKQNGRKEILINDISYKIRRNTGQKMNNNSFVHHQIKLLKERLCVLFDLKDDPFLSRKKQGGSSYLILPEITIKYNDNLYKSGRKFSENDVVNEFEEENQY